MLRHLGSRERFQYMNLGDHKHSVHNRSQHQSCLASPLWPFRGCAHSGKTRLLWMLALGNWVSREGMSSSLIVPTNPSCSWNKCCLCVCSSRTNTSLLSFRIVPLGFKRIQYQLIHSWIEMPVSEPLTMYGIHEYLLLSRKFETYRGQDSWAWLRVISRPGRH